MNNNPIYNNIKEVLIENKEAIYSAMFIGSNFNFYRNNYLPESDIDLFIIIKEMDYYNKIVGTIKKKLYDSDIKVIDSWGIVDQNIFTKKVLHLLIDPIWHFKTRKLLFRKSLEQYPVIFGNSLNQFIPKQIVAEEFLYFGPHRMLERLESNDWDSFSWKKDNSTWYLAKTKNIYADQNSIIHYACIHSIINTIRYVSSETKPIEYNKVASKWKKINGPNLAFVKQIISTKISNKKNFQVSVNDANYFLRNICNWLESHYLQQSI